MAPLSINDPIDDEFRIHEENSQQLMGNGQWVINNGTNGRWQEILTDAELVLYEKARAKAIRLGFSAECLKRLETGQKSAKARVKQIFICPS